MSKALLRVCVPDSHGEHIDLPARDAFLRDLKSLNPDEVVLLGDHIDCGGVFTSHARSYTNEMTESFEDDTDATNAFFDLLQKAAPKARIHYLEGNHEARIERWAAQTFPSAKDARKFLRAMGPEAVLKLKDRGIKYYRGDTCYQGIGIPGTIRLGKVYFTHGISASSNATQVHLVRFGDNVVHGHTHRAASVHGRTVRSGVIGAWCPGTLAKLQPLYRHTAPTNWSHGYGLQAVSHTGRFVHFNVPLVNGESMLGAVTRIVNTPKGRAA